METCEFCGEEAKYKITTKLNPNSVSYACKDCMDKKTKEMQEQLNSYIGKMSNNSLLAVFMGFAYSFSTCIMLFRMCFDVCFIMPPRKELFDIFPM